MANEEITALELNPLLGKELHTLPELMTKTEEIAQEIAAYARGAAPVETGRYRDGIVVDKPNAKGVSRVHATDQKSVWIEFGNGKQQPMFILRSAAEACGYSLKSSR